MTELLRADPRHARNLLHLHFPTWNGWCYHQGSLRVRYRFPCRLYVCALDALTNQGYSTAW